MTRASNERVGIRTTGSTVAWLLLRRAARTSNCHDHCYYSVAVSSDRFSTMTARSGLQVLEHFTARSDQPLPEAHPDGPDGWDGLLPLVGPDSDACRHPVCCNPKYGTTVRTVRIVR
jgi:hypothetical protein